MRACVRGRGIREDGDDDKGKNIYICLTGVNCTDCTERSLMDRSLLLKRNETFSMVLRVMAEHVSSTRGLQSPPEPSCGSGNTVAELRVHGVLR